MNKLLQIKIYNVSIVVEDKRKAVPFDLQTYFINAYRFIHSIYHNITLTV
jgi:hypothetical protein